VRAVVPCHTAPGNRGPGIKPPAASAAIQRADVSRHTASGCRVPGIKSHLSSSLPPAPQQSDFERQPEPEPLAAVQSEVSQAVSSQQSAVVEQSEVSSQSAVEQQSVAVNQSVAVEDQSAVIQQLGSPA